MSNDFNDITVRELLRLMTFYQTMHPSTSPSRMLKISGWKIAGLEGTSLANWHGLQCGEHRLAVHDRLQAQLCTCGGWEKDKSWDMDKGRAQHKMHARLESRSLPVSTRIAIPGLLPTKANLELLASQ